MLKLVVLVCAFAAASASAPVYSAPLTLSAYPIAYGYPWVQPYNYRGPLSLAPGEPAEILGADGRPLDTLEVNRDRAEHFAAKTGVHLLKKRSTLIAAILFNDAAMFLAQLYAQIYTQAGAVPPDYVEPYLKPDNTASNIVQHS